MEGESATLFRRLHHVSLVVRNLDASVACLERLGFGPFVAYPPLEDYVELDVPDVAAFRALRIKVCRLGPVALQVIEAKDGRTIYGSFLEAGGEGIFHLGFQVEDIRAAEAQAGDLGLRILSRGRRRDGSGFAYLDTAEATGVTLLVRQNPEGGAPAMRQVRQRLPPLSPPGSRESCGGGG